MILLACFAGLQAQTVEGDSIINVQTGRVRLNASGFPEQLQFAPRIDLLAENIHFHFTRQADGKDIKPIPGGIHFASRTPLHWEVVGKSDELSVRVDGSVEQDSVIKYAVRVEALQDLDLKEITMHIPFMPSVAKNIIGLDETGGWVGNKDAGLKFSLQERAVWANEGKGGVTLGIKGRSMLANSWSGPHTLKKGDVLNYIFTLKMFKLGS